MAQQCGMLVLWSRCWESEGAPPFWPWAELLRGLVRSRGAALLRAELGAGAPLIAQLAPEAHDLLGDLPAPPPLEPAEAPFRLFHSIAERRPNTAASPGSGRLALG